MKFYAVRRGRQVGVYSNWKACREQVNGYPGAQYKAFSNREEAEAFIHSPELLQSTPPRFLNQPEPHKAKDHHVNIWVDGACIKQSDGTRLLGWAFLVQANHEELHRDRGHDIPAEAHQHWNVAGEIMAVLKAVSWCLSQQITEITIHHDYEGLASWATGQWQARTTFTRAYRDTLRRAGLTIHWQKVKAHSGEPGNEVVDKLAREAALQQKKGM